MFLGCYLKLTYFVERGNLGTPVHLEQILFHSVNRLEVIKSMGCYRAVLCKMDMGQKSEVDFDSSCSIGIRRWMTNKMNNYCSEDLWKVILCGLENNDLGTC